jgi:hypothetical protein
MGRLSLLISIIATFYTSQPSCHCAFTKTSNYFKQFTKWNKFEHSCKTHYLYCPTGYNRCYVSSTIFKSSNRESSHYDNNESHLQQGQQQQSIGDVVQNLHGGKYQFDYPMASSSLSFIGQQFAQSMYATSPDGTANEQYADEDKFDDNDLPMWVQKLGSTIPTNSFETIDFSNRDIGTISLQIQNEERTWERYYAKILNLSTTEDNTYVKLHTTNFFEIVVGQQGMLAPRGGAGGISDIATIILRRLKPTLETTYWNSFWLAVGTEEKNWYYQLKLH